MSARWRVFDRGYLASLTDLLVYVRVYIQHVLRLVQTRGWSREALLVLRWRLLCITAICCSWFTVSPYMSSEPGSCSDNPAAAAAGKRTQYRRGRQRLAPVHSSSAADIAGWSDPASWKHTATGNQSSGLASDVIWYQTTTRDGRDCAPGWTDSTSW